MTDFEKIGDWLKKNITKKDLFGMIGAVFLFLGTRLYNILLLPIFTDEGIYIRWAKVAWHDATWRFISLTDGRQPLQTWGTIPFLKLFPNNALLGGRLFSVAMGLFALCGLFALLYRLFGKKTAWIGVLLYIFSPYFLFYDRMALIDSGVNAFFIWIILFSVLLASSLRLDVALLFGMVAGFGLLAKSSVQMFFAVSFFTGFLLIPYGKKPIQKAINYLLLFGISFALSELIYNVQRLSPFMHYITDKNGTFVMTFGEWIKSPFAVLFSNLKTVPYYVFAESGWIVVPFACIALFFLFKKNIRLFLFFVTWLLVPYLGISAMTRVLYPRYIIFFGTLLVILTAYVLGEIKNKRILTVSLSLIIGVFLIFQYPMWTNYQKILFPPVDRGQYIDGVPVGYGIKEIIAYAREKSKEKPVIILAEGNFGLTGDMLDTFLLPTDTRISLQGLWPLTKNDLLAHQKDIGKNYVYVVTAHYLTYPSDWPIHLLQAFYKQNKEAAIQLFELTK